MLDHKHSFNIYFENLLKEIDPNLNFFPLPNMDLVKYPAVVFHYGPQTKTSTLTMWKQELQIDVLYTDWQDSQCDLTTAKILDELGLANDLPGNPKRIEKTQYINTNDGSVLNPPTPHLQNNSQIQWRMGPDESVDRIEEGDKPELMRNTFNIVLYYKHN